MKWTVVAIVIIALVAIASFEFFELSRSTGTASTGSTTTCLAIPGGSVLRTQTTSTSFGPVTEYQIPGLDRYPGPVTTAPDGSIWFAEWEVPGVAHLYPNNGTLVEYAWKGYPKPSPRLFCGPPASISGIELWEGKVWATDEYGSAIVGVNPADGSTTLLNTTSKILPYWLAVGPDGNLWFTSDNSPAYIGRVLPNMTVSLIGLTGMGTDNPLELEFVNSSLAFISAINLADNPKTQACICDGRIYSFNPSHISTQIAPRKIGGNFSLFLPTSVSYYQGKIWVAQHLASGVVSYDFATERWTTYPTSRVPWTNTTLPLFVDAKGGRVWLNEHYANKIAFIDPSAGTLTEISASNPPATSNEGIQNDEYFVVSGGRVWFTSLSGNYVGYIDRGFEPSFHIGVVGHAEATISPGGSASFTLSISGTWGAPMKVGVSDSESYSSVPDLIHLTPSSSSVPAGSSSYALGLDAVTEGSIRAGNYTIAVTVTNGGVQQTAYLYLAVK